MDVYKSGYAFGYQGLEVTRNPYPSDSEEFHAWDLGHIDGETDAETDYYNEFDADSDYDEWDCDDSMDGDFDSAMSSAGFGTDEDYDHCNDDCDY